MKIRYFLLLVSVIYILCGCQNSVVDHEVAENSVVFTDDLGREITVSSPKRVAALLGSYADIWCLSGGTVVATADDAWDDFNLELSEDVINIGMTKSPSMEKLLEAAPDFVIASVNTQANLDMKDTLEAAKIAVAYFDVSDFDDYLRMLKICAQINGRDDLYEVNGLEIEKQIDCVIEQSRQRLESKNSPKILYLRASATNIRAKNSSGTVLGAMLKDLGCVNIADHEKDLLEHLNIEYILQEDPEYIFVVQAGDDTAGTKEALAELMGDTSPWSGLSAVKNDQVYVLDKRLFNLKPNARWGEAYEILEGILGDE